VKKLIVVLALGLAACSQAPAARQDVASLSTPASTPASSAAPKEERPRERLDMTDADYEAMLVPHTQCLAQHGVGPKGQPLPGGPKPSQQGSDAAHQACESKLPLPPWEKDVTNPEAIDFANRVVQCLRGKGVRYVEVLNQPGAEAVSYALGGPGNDQQSITLGLEHAKACEIEASKK
jgi:hypothetical protein